MLVSCNELHSVIVVMPGPAISVCHKKLCFLARLFVFFSSLVIVVAYYKAMQRLTVILKRLELCLNNDCVFANASLH